jgi:hypothetical protein
MLLPRRITHAVVFGSRCDFACDFRERLQACFQAIGGGSRQPRKSLEKRREKPVFGAS